MKPSEALETHRVAIREIVAAHRGKNPRVFGSVLHGADSEGSDLDILIDPTPQTTMFDIGAIRHELKELLGVTVDVQTPRALPESFRSEVIGEAVPIWPNGITPGSIPLRSRIAEVRQLCGVNVCLSDPNGKVMLSEPSSRSN